MHNIEIAWLFRELAALLEIKGESTFKTGAYRKGADILEGLGQPAEEMTEAELLGISGFGKALAAKTRELAETGRIRALEELRREIPPGIVQALLLPGIGPKAANRLLTHLPEVVTLQDLEAAAKAKKIRRIPGLGPKVEVNIQRGIARLRERSGRTLLAEAGENAWALGRFLKRLGAERTAIVGGIRRGEEMVSQLELVVDPGEVPLDELAEILGKHPLLAGGAAVREVEGYGVITSSLRSGIPVVVWLVRGSEFIPAVLYHTGETGHWRRLQELAREKGIVLGPREYAGEYAGSRGENPIQGVPAPYAWTKDWAWDTAIYAALGLPYIPPEIREDKGELEAAAEGQLPQVVSQSDLRGDLHLHSKWSDGVNTIEELAENGQKLGYEYIGITDHSRSLAIARGLSAEKLLEQKREIAQLNEHRNGFRIFTGVEMDILQDGRLDYPDDILAEMDLVVGSIHSGFQQEGSKLTDRLLGAIQNPHVDIIGHPTGRVLARRDPYSVDVRAVIEAAAKYSTILEINCSPDRLDLKAEYCRQAKEAGVKLAVNTDAHGIGGMSDVNLGVMIARKGWLASEDIVNTWPLDRLLEFLQK